jgi:CO/xanthine dehydrogenase Mo-binding subunit
LTACWRSPSPHARITSLDVSPALTMDGVVMVLTYRDVPRVRFGNYAFQHGPAGPRSAQPGAAAQEENRRIQDVFILGDATPRAAAASAPARPAPRARSRRAQRAGFGNHRHAQGRGVGWQGKRW